MALQNLAPFWPIGTILHQNLTLLKDVEYQLENLLKSIKTLKNTILKSFFSRYWLNALPELFNGAN